MLAVNGKNIELTTFPDGTLLLKDLLPVPGRNIIVWKYRNETELVMLIYITKHLQSLGAKNIVLDMPYIPNARMDRVQHDDQVFTLKHFAAVINSLGFSEVHVLDPHSNVATALIDRVRVDHPTDCILKVLREIGAEVHEYTYMDMYGCGTEYHSNTLLFYPDEGAMKRYSELLSGSKMPYAFGIKRRDFDTGKILGLDVSGDVDRIAGKNVLIIDDISSRGGTFLHSAKKLKELGADNIYLFVTHCENTIHSGDLLTSGLVKHVYTTDSTYSYDKTDKSNMITVFKLED